MKELILHYLPDILKIVIELLIIYLILKYGLTKNKEFKLTEYEVNKIIEDFEPEEIIELNFKEILTYEEKNMN